ncbi:MAG: tRNA preQ1(34) S-adenosylmethionine ribosyltransferase-isomerase QueA [Chloroflexi bacterium]|nr:tRNA preQ1(34) S-adenosylmethionine ribosyltransferase-isomerase QueA [Chloroflexota bacterium]
METRDFEYCLPPGCIAQTPVEPRDSSRLMVLSRADASMEHRRFHDIVDLLRPGDVLVCNDSRVIPARLWGRKETGGKVEILLLRRLEEGRWETLVRPGRKVAVGARLYIGNGAGNGRWAQGEVLERTAHGTRLVRFCPEEHLEALGEVPLPPYIHARLDCPERYQTVYAREKGSVAAPTAGLHFTPELLESLRARGVDIEFVTLHVGLDSFRPVRVEDPRQHDMHQEYCEVSEEVASKLAKARREGRRIIAAGTTAVRALEQAALAGEDGRFKGWANLLILPGHEFKSIDGLITNFHLPRSSLLMLVSAFAGREFVLRAYQKAIDSGYRFYSFGDAMAIF